MQPRPMDARAYGIGGQLARSCNLFVTETGDLAHQEHIAVERRERREGLVDSQVDILGWGSCRLADQHCWLRVP